MSEQIRMLKLTRYLYDDDDPPEEGVPPRDDVIYVAATAIRRISVDEHWRNSKRVEVTCIETSDQGMREEVLETPTQVLLMMGAEIREPVRALPRTRASEPLG